MSTDEVIFPLTISLDKLPPGTVKAKVRPREDRRGPRGQRGDLEDGRGPQRQCGVFGDGLGTSRAGEDLGDNMQSSGTGSWGQCGTTELAQRSSPGPPFWVHQRQGRIWGQEGTLIAMWGLWGQHSDMGWRAGSSPAPPSPGPRKPLGVGMGDRRSRGDRGGARGWTRASHDPTCVPAVPRSW